MATRSVAGDTIFGQLFQQNAPKPFGLSYQADGSEGPNTPYWQSAGGDNTNTESIMSSLQPYMGWGGSQLMDNWSSIPENLRATLGATPTDFAKKLSYEPDGQGGWRNTFVEKKDFMGDTLLPLVMGGIVGGGLGGFFDPFSTTGAAGGLGAGTNAAGWGALEEAAALGGGLGSSAPIAPVISGGINAPLGLAEEVAGLGGTTTTPPIAPGAPTLPNLPNVPSAPSGQQTVSEEIAGLGGTPDTPPVAPGTPTLPSIPGTPGAPSTPATPGAPGTTGAGAAGTAISRILGGTATAADWASVLGTAGSTLLGLIGSNQQSNQIADLARQYQEYGAPSRARYESSMTPGFNPSSIPGYQGAVDNSMNTMLRKLSTSGNPFGNPGGLMEANKAVISGTALPALSEYQRLNANTGFGSSMNAALNLQTQGIGADAGVLNSLGYGLNALTNPQPDYADLLRRLTGGINLNNGGSLT